MKPHIDEIKKQPPHHYDEDGYLIFKKGSGNGNHAEQSMASLYLLVSMRPKLRRELKLKPRFKYLELLPKLNKLHLALITEEYSIRYDLKQNY